MSQCIGSHGALAVGRLGANRWFSTSQLTRSGTAGAHQPGKVDNTAPRARARSRSILFDDAFLRQQAYKSLKPKSELEPPPEVTERPKKELPSSFFDRMRDSPIRRCAVTGAKLPNDFLICFRTSPTPVDSPAILPPHADASGSTPTRTRPTTWLVPDRVEHPRFERKRGGKGKWVLCRRETVQGLLVKGAHKRLNNTAGISPDISGHIETLLRHRVVQELELLAERLRCLPTSSARAVSDADGNPGNGVAIKWFPTLQHLLADEEQRRRQSSDNRGLGDGLQAVLEVDLLEGTHHGSDGLQRHTNSDATCDLAAGIRFHQMDTSCIPVYHASRCLPSSCHAALLGHLETIHRADRRYLASRGIEPSTIQDAKERSAVGIYSSRALRRRGPGADTVPLLVALWRLCMWSSAEGRAWRGGSNDQVRHLEGWEELLEGFKTVQGVMHTKW